MTYEENVRTILECNFAGFKDEIIDRAVKLIMELEPKQIVILKGVELPPYVPTYPQIWYESPTISPEITCENLKNSEN
jgi:hypothetical protein